MKSNSFLPFLALVLITALAVCYSLTTNWNPELEWKQVLNQKVSCHWSFVKYEASDFEQKWMAIVKENPTAKGMCLDLHSPKHSRETYELARIVLDLKQRKKQDPSKFHFFSKLHYKQTCQDGSSMVSLSFVPFIEYLTSNIPIYHSYLTNQ